MTRSGAVGLICCGAALVVAGLLLARVDGLLVLSMAIGAVGLTAIIVGAIRCRRTAPTAPTRDQLVGGVTLGACFVALGTLGHSAAQSGLSSLVFTVGGIALIGVTVARYRRRARS